MHCQGFNVNMSSSNFQVILTTGDYGKVTQACIFDFDLAQPDRSHEVATATLPNNNKILISNM